MLAIIVSVVVVLLLLTSLRTGRSGGLITHTPYNNPHSDATGAREDFR